MPGFPPSPRHAPCIFSAALLLAGYIGNKPPELKGGRACAQLKSGNRPIVHSPEDQDPAMTNALLPRPRVYLAGFDVFRRDARAFGERLREACAEYGFEGLYPLDTEVPADLDGPRAAAWIYRANLDAIRGADIVMANVDDFRGPGEPDSGTAFEIGFAAALGKEIWAYTTDAGTLIERVPSQPAPAGRECARGFLVEDFGLPKNLMIACAAHIVNGDARACLAAMAQSHEA
jgi:nucleoside 2-deoxyribosyltransferase